MDSLLNPHTIIDVFEHGDRSFDELVAQMKRGILVTSFIGGNSNSTTGDFSMGIIGAYVEDGKAIRPVNEMNISGNLTDTLKNLVETGNDPWVHSAWRRPSLYFRDIQFSGIYQRDKSGSREAVPGGRLLLLEDSGSVGPGMLEVSIIHRPSVNSRL